MNRVGQEVTVSGRRVTVPPTSRGFSAVANRSHKRETEARRSMPRARQIIGPLAVLATASAVTIGVVSADPAASDLTTLSGATADVSTPSTAASPAASRPDLVTRADDRTKVAPPVTSYASNFMSKAAVKQAVEHASQHRWTTTDLNIWNQPGEKASKLGELDAGKKVLVTGRSFWGRTEIVLEGQSRWVTSGYLSHDKPAPAPAGLSMAPCPDPGVENGLTDGAVYVYRSVCHAFPQITSYGGWDGHGEHASGKALDIMTSDKALGDQIAAFLQSHASELHLYDVIWWDRIWTPVRAAEGWRYYGDRGSATANHMDHVHVSVY
jgi:hypothetical protein